MEGKPERPSGKGMVMDVLRAFRERLHDCFVRRADALFELCDAVLVASNPPRPPT